MATPNPPRPGSSTRARALIGGCALIAGVDLLQVPLLGKGVGALGGAAVYGLLAVLLARGHRWPMWVAAAMPLIPVAVFSGLLGQELRQQLVDGPMVAVFALQLAVAGLAVAQLFSASQRGSSQGEAS